VGLLQHSIRSIAAERFADPGAFFTVRPEHRNV
jgi:hypothetical protein